MPTARAAIGTSECPVMPGEVFTSRSQGLFRLSSMMSTRPQPRQPTARNARSVSACSSASFFFGSPHGQWYFVSSVKYLFW